MKEYIEAREKTKGKIEKAYWDLYEKNERITVGKICDKAGIHRSTFYFYYEWIDDVLDSIKNRLLEQLEKTLNNENAKKHDFRQLTFDLKKMFDENRRFLIPLLLNQSGGKFSVEYRQILKKELARDIGLETVSGNMVKDDIANCVLNGMIEMFIYSISSEIIPLDLSFIMGYGTMEHGVRQTLREDLNINISQTSMHAEE